MLRNPYGHMFATIHSHRYINRPKPWVKHRLLRKRPCHTADGKTLHHPSWGLCQNSSTPNPGYFSNLSS